MAARAATPVLRASLAFRGPLNFGAGGIELGRIERRVSLFWPNSIVAELRIFK